MWLGIVSLLGVAQFWSLAVDLYSREEGERLFGVIAIGGSAGAIVGAQLAQRLIERLGIYGLMVLAGGLTRSRSSSSRSSSAAGAPVGGPRRARGATDARRALADRPRSLPAPHRRAAARREPGQYAGGVHPRRRGEGLRRPVPGGGARGDHRALLRWLLRGGERAGARRAGVSVARLLKRGGTRWALFLLPGIALLGYGTIALPAVAGVVATAKAAEQLRLLDGGDGRADLVPAHDARIKYTGKAAVDTICVRLGDMAAGGLVLIACTSRAVTAWVRRGQPDAGRALAGDRGGRRAAAPEPRRRRAPRLRAGGGAAGAGRVVQERRRHGCEDGSAARQDQIARRPRCVRARGVRRRRRRDGLRRGSGGAGFPGSPIAWQEHDSEDVPRPPRPPTLATSTRRCSCATTLWATSIARCARRGSARARRECRRRGAVLDLVLSPQSPAGMPLDAFAAVRSGQRAAAPLRMVKGRTEATRWDSSSSTPNGRVLLKLIPPDTWA